MILGKRITLQGIYVGPISALQNIARSGITPQIDKVFSFQAAEDAYSHLQHTNHFGKVVIRIGS